MAWGFDPFPGYSGSGFECHGDACCNDYHSANCPGDFVAHRPSGWYVRADLAPRTIDHADGFDVARIGPLGDAVLRTEDLRPEFDPGGKFTIGRRVFGCYRVEATYHTQYDWEDFRIVTNSGDDLSTVLSGFSMPITPGLDNAGTVDIGFHSSFMSGEANVRYWADMPPGPFDVSFLIGARYVKLDEEFRYRGVVDLPVLTTSIFQSATKNEMYGAQIGIQGSWLVTVRTWIEMDLKGAILNDHVTLNSFVSTTPGVVTPDNTTIRDRTSYLLDLELSANWQMTPTLSLRAGYQAMWFEGVALARDQIRSPLVNNLPGPFDDSGRACIHGPLLGVTAQW